ncbi:unnamed protein product, partial [Symbiodinium pilosum]
MFYPKHDWCGHQDLIRLHVLALDAYDAVAYYDADCEFQGDITPVLRCAATGKLLTTNGGVGESLNVGFIAVRERGTDKNECEKLRFREKRKELARQRREQHKRDPEQKLLRHSGGLCAACLEHVSEAKQGRGTLPAAQISEKRERLRERGSAAGRMLRSCRLQKRETALDLVTVLPVDADDDDDESLGTVQLRLGRLADAAGASEEQSGSESEPPPLTSPTFRFDVDMSKAEGHTAAFAPSGAEEIKPHSPPPTGQSPVSPAAAEFLGRPLYVHLKWDIANSEFPREPAASSSTAASPEVIQGKKRAEGHFASGSDPTEGPDSLSPEIPYTALSARPFAILASKAHWGPTPCDWRAFAIWAAFHNADRFKRSVKGVAEAMAPADLLEQCFAIQFEGLQGFPDPLVSCTFADVARLAAGEALLARFSGDVTWCNKAFRETPPAAVGLSYGIEERDIWSELISQKMLRTKLYDCFIPPERSTPISGKAPNGTRRCQGVEARPCYTSKYEAYRICLGAKAGIVDGRRYEDLHAHLLGLPALSVHLKIDTEGSEWPVLASLLASEDVKKIRTLDMEVHFGWGAVTELSQQERLAGQVATMEKLREVFYCTGSTLEVYRQGWRPLQDCEKGNCK